MRMLWGCLVFVMGGILGVMLGTGGLVKPDLQIQQRPTAGARQNLQSFNTVPDFSLTEQSGRPLTLTDLREKVWIANVMYTTCPDFYPLQSAEMMKLQEEFSDRSDVRLVSVTVDPERDTPLVLSRYAEQLKANRDHWLFLTGKPAEVARLVQQGLGLNALSAVNGKEAHATPMLHSNRFVLVDGHAHIWGYYRSNDTEDLRRLRHNLNTLLEGKKV